MVTVQHTVCSKSFCYKVVLELERWLSSYKHLLLLETQTPALVHAPTQTYIHTIHTYMQLKVINLKSPVSLLLS